MWQWTLQCNFSTTATTSPTNPGGACCVDPTTLNALNDIYSLLQFVYNGLPLSLNSFAESTVHSGVTGTGSFGISGGAVAIKVELTTIPSFIGQELGTPTFYFDCGF